MCERRENESMVAYVMRYVAEQPRSVLAVVAMVAVCAVYADLKSFISDSLDNQRETAKILSELSTRIQELEGRYDKFHPIK